MNLDDEEMGSLSLTRNALSPPYRFLLITVYPCSLGSLACADMDTDINGKQLILMLNRYSFDPENKADPVKVAPFVDTIIYLEKNISVQK